MEWNLRHAKSPERKTGSNRETAKRSELNDSKVLNEVFSHNILSKVFAWKKKKKSQKGRT